MNRSFYFMKLRILSHFASLSSRAIRDTLYLFLNSSLMLARSKHFYRVFLNNAYLKVLVASL